MAALKPISNPPNPWRHEHVEWLGEPPQAELVVYEQKARSMLSGNDSPDLPFRWSLNPYRGCYHGCAYCYARPTHEYLDFGAGTDFDRRIVVKTNAAEILRKELRRSSWTGEAILFSGNTDCYQPLEASYELTRRCLEVCRDHANPVVVITKGSLIRRDVDVLGEVAARARVRVFFSLPFGNDEDGLRIEPHAAVISQRLKSMRLLSEAGIETGVAVAPIIPGLNDSHIPEILERAHEAGARWAFFQMVRLPGPVAGIFRERLEQAWPERAQKVMHAIEEARGGKLNESAFGQRMGGLGPRWQMIENLFRLHATRLGYQLREVEPPARKPPAQTALF